MEDDDVTEEATARMAQALSHPVRLRILKLLREEGAYVMHLTAMLGRPQANISQHLAILRDAGLVTDEREGMTRVYRVRDARVFDVMERLAKVAPARWRVADEEEPPFPWRGAGPAMRGVGPEMRGMGPGARCHCPRCSG